MGVTVEIMELDFRVRKFHINVIPIWKLNPQTLADLNSRPLRAECDLDFSGMELDWAAVVDFIDLENPILKWVCWELVESGPGLHDPMLAE